MKYGAVATTADFQSKHENLCSKLLKNETILSVITDVNMEESIGTQPPVDIARNLFGDSFSAEELTGYLRSSTHDNSAPALPYSLDADSAIRYKLSHACRIKINNTKTAFCKRAVLRELPYAIEKSIKTPYKLARDIKANTNEAIFLNECVKDCEIFKEKFGNNGKSDVLRVFPPYFCEAIVYPHYPLDSKFLCLLTDFSPMDGWKQHAHLEKEHLETAVEAMGEWHAHFWLEKIENDGNDPKMAKMLKVAETDAVEKLWQPGCYWDISKQPEGQVAGIEKSWKKVFDELYSKIEDSKPWSEVEFYGQKMAKNAAKLDELLHRNGIERQTVIHGDLKASNWFMRKTSTGKTQAGLIDFQWTGVGVAGVDLAYLVLASVHENDVKNDLPVSAETGNPLTRASPMLSDLARKYHLTLKSKVAPDQKVPNFQKFEAQFALAIVDLCRTAVSDHLCKLGGGTSKTIYDVVLEREQSPDQKKLVFNAYNKNRKVVRWMIGVLGSLLKDIDEIYSSAV